MPGFVTAHSDSRIQAHTQEFVHLCTGFTQAALRAGTPETIKWMEMDAEQFMIIINDNQQGCEDCGYKTSGVMQGMFIPMKSPSETYESGENTRTIS